MRRKGKERNGLSISRPHIWSATRPQRPLKPLPPLTLAPPPPPSTFPLPPTPRPTSFFLPISLPPSALASVSPSLSPHPPTFLPLFLLITPSSPPPPFPLPLPPYHPILSIPSPLPASPSLPGSPLSFAGITAILPTPGRSEVAAAAAREDSLPERNSKYTVDE